MLVNKADYQDQDLRRFYAVRQPVNLATGHGHAMILTFEH